MDFSKPLFLLAPLAGYSDLPLRGVVKKFGCDATFSEMISASALALDSSKTKKMVEKNPYESPYFVQIMGSNLQHIKRSVEILNDIDGIDGIDLNCGCPVSKVIKQNAGSALLSDLSLLQDIITTIKKHSKKKFTSAKVRLGFEKENIVEIVKLLEGCGVDFITIHGRTKIGGYSAKVNYDLIAKAVDAVKTPIFANGDINLANIDYVLQHTKSSGAMIGRACIGHPWIFLEIKDKTPISNETKKQVILFHFEQMVKYYGHNATSIFRKHLHRYSKGYDGASEFREKINKIDDTNLMLDEIKSFF